jgi:hypothetical protein
LPDGTILSDRASQNFAKVVVDTASLCDKFGQMKFSSETANGIACKSSVDMVLLFAIALLIRFTSISSWKKINQIR